MIAKLPVLLITALAWSVSAHADPLSAAGARQALGAGATAWDLRPHADALLPGAVRADLGAWWATRSDASLAQAVSAAGIDLSRDVVVYGRAGDAAAQALVAQLATLASGRVHWLVGGIDEWQAAGLPTVAQAAARLPVPQHLVRRAAAGADAAPAAASLRRSEPAAALLATRL